MPETRHSNTRQAFAACTVLLSLSLAACATDRESRTQLDWNLSAHHDTNRDSATYYTVRVRPGDTLSELSDRYDVSTKSVARLNDISDSDSIYAGEMLRIPAGSRATRDAVYADATSRPSRSNPYVPAPEPRRGGYPNSNAVTVTNLPPVNARPSSTPAPKVVASNTPVKTHAWYTPVTPTPSSSLQPSSGPVVQQQQNVPGSPRFVWPVSGRVISEFGSNNSGERNDGINIAAHSGDPIRAAASGTVTYAGNQLRGYGNLLLIKHDDGYVTAYAHAQTITVQKGDRVLKGQAIATIGQTGDVTAPQLHFEIRRGITPVNPMALLVASR